MQLLQMKSFYISERRLLDTDLESLVQLENRAELTGFITVGIYIMEDR